MSENQHMEQLSCLVDGELNGSEGRFLLKRLSHDDELAGCWRRYHLYRNIIRSGHSKIEDDLADRVFAAINGEPAPKRSTVYRWLKPAAGIAVAATVAIAVFNALYLAPTTVPDPDAADTALASESEFNGVPTVPQRASVASRAVLPADAASDPRLQAYVLRHNEAIVRRGQGLVPYIYMVSAPDQPETEDAADEQSVAK